MSDGSHKDLHSTAAFVLEIQSERTPLITGSIVVPGAASALSPFRAELFGILTTIAWIERHGTTHGISHGTICCGFDNQAGYKQLCSPYPVPVQQPDFDLITTI